MQQNQLAGHQRGQPLAIAHGRRMIMQWRTLWRTPGPLAALALIVAGVRSGRTDGRPACAASARQRHRLHA